MSDSSDGDRPGSELESMIATMGCLFALGIAILGFLLGTTLFSLSLFLIGNMFWAENPLNAVRAWLVFLLIVLSVAWFLIERSRRKQQQ